MNILWLTNGIMPDMADAMNMKRSYGGSWLLEPAAALAKDEKYNLSIVTPWSGKESMHKKINGIDYYLIPSSYLDRMKRPSKAFEERCRQVIEEIQPDVIHLQGSEFAIGIPFARYKDVPKIIAIQGLIWKINADYFYGGIKVPSWLGCLMPWNMLTYLPMRLQHARNKWRANSELEQLKLVDGVIGCTRWDNTYSRIINPNLKYYDIHYSIRKEFSQREWNIENVDRHTFLIGSMTVPLKGLHRAMEALAILIKKYPDAKIRVVGANTFKSKYKIGYTRYLYKKAKELGVLENLELLGPQDTEGMVNTMLKTHTYVLSSCIENGPNTMFEAMHLGMPCVCSYVGGAMQFAKEDEEAVFYRFEEPEVLAYELDRIWENDDWAQKLSENGRKRAQGFQTMEQIYEKTLKMYDDLAE